MALTLDGATGLFAKVGAFYKAIVNAEAATNLTIADRQQIINSIIAAARLYLIRAVQVDTPIRGTLEAALAEVEKQAIAQSESCDAQTTSVTPDATTLISTGVLRIGNSIAVYDRLGNAMNNALPGTVRIECIGGPEIGKNYSAQWLITPSPKPGLHESGWFSGYDFSPFVVGMASAQVDGNSHQNNTNILTNSGFERFTSNVPDNWELVTGTGGTHITSVTTPYIGTNALKFIGTGGASLTKIRQVLGDGTGSPVQLRANTWYVLTGMVRRYATGAVTGVLRFSIEDSGGTERYSSGIAIDLSTATTTYSDVGVCFYTGDTLQSTNYAVVELTTTLGNTHEIYIDELVLVPLFAIPGVMHLGMIEGSGTAGIGDAITFTMANNGTGLQQVAWERLFGMSRFMLSMPTNDLGAETITDSISVTTPN